MKWFLTLVVIMRRLKTLTNNYPQTSLIHLTFYTPLPNYQQTPLFHLTLLMPLPNYPQTPLFLLTAFMLQFRKPLVTQCCITSAEDQNYAVVNFHKETDCPDLSERDFGMYYCGVEIVGSDPGTEVNLKVITAQQIRSVRGYSGGNIIINFKYEEKHKNHEKYVCKSAADQCFTVINTNRAAEWKHDRRFSVHDDRSAGLLRLFIRELNENDSGEYNITVKVSEEYSFFSEFNLNISDDDCCVKSISLSAAAGGSVNISCKYPQSHSRDVKFLCWRSGADLCAEETSVNQSRRWSPEGKIQLYDDREEQLLTGSISHVTEQHSEYWCGVQSDQGHKSFITRVLISLTGSSLIIPLVLFFLVLIIAGLLLLFFCKKRQSQGGDSSSQTGPGKHEVVSHTGCDEEIKDAHKQLPTNPSDSSNCVYATVQKATGDSQCCITSAEDQNYAVVNFHKKSDCPDSVRIRDNQDYSEYAAVSDLTA